MRKRRKPDKLQPTVEMQEWLSPSQAARLLGVTTARVRQLSLVGELPFEQTPMGRMYPRVPIEQLAEERQTKRGRKPRSGQTTKGED